MVVLHINRDKTDLLHLFNLTELLIRGGNSVIVVGGVDYEKITNVYHIFKIGKIAEKWELRRSNYSNSNPNYQSFNGPRKGNGSIFCQSITFQDKNFDYSGITTLADYVIVY